MKMWCRTCVLALIPWLVHCRSVDRPTAQTPVADIDPATARDHGAAPAPIETPAPVSAPDAKAANGQEVGHDAGVVAADALLRQVLDGAVRGPADTAPIAPAVPIPAFPQGQKKVVYLGWTYPTTQYFKAHVDELDGLPLDGSAIDVLINRAKGQSPENTLGRNLFSETRYSMNDANFVAAATDMADATPTRFKYNFFQIATGYEFEDPQGRFSWFDDNRFATIANNWMILANIAYRSKARGFIVDFESYSPKIDFFSLAFQKAADMKRGVVKDDAAYKATARQRGFDIMTAIAPMFPNPEFLMCWGETVALKGRGASWDTWAEHFTLLSPFLEGMRMASRPGNGTQFIDGYEFGYYFTTAREFDVGLGVIRNGVKNAGLVTSPSLYDSFVRASFGIYLDYRKGPDLPQWHPDNRRNSALQIEKMLGAALARADQYVWLYSQKAVFFGPKANIEPEYIDAVWKAKGVAR